MPGLQEFIHQLEEGKGVTILKWTVVALSLLILTAVYDLREFKNFSTEEAMDTAQLARNIADGKGYHTDCVRPLSMYILQRHHGVNNTMLRQGHPDITNPPLYPLMLAGLMKSGLFKYDIDVNGQFNRYQPEFLIALFNQIWFFIATGMVYLLGKRLFDASVAWLAAGIFVCADLFWRFSISGLSSMFLVVLLLGVVWCLVRMDQGQRDEQPHGAIWFILWAGAAGALVGLAALTRYSCASWIVPVSLFFVFYFGRRRMALILTSLVACGLLLSPWLARNYRVSGTFLGTAGYAIYEDTPAFPETSLVRSLKLDEAQIQSIAIEDYLRKLWVNLRPIVEHDLPRIGGSWISAFFLVGLLVPFQNLTLSRLRIFLIACLVVMTIVQALARTHISLSETDVSSENLLVLCAPVLFIFGAALFRLLLNQIELPFPELRRPITGLAWIIASAPLVFTLLSPRVNPIAYPPYYPWVVQNVARFMKPDELMMSDIPWGVAWYGRRQCVWNSLAIKDFLTIYDEQKPVQGLYLTQVTLDSRFLSRLVKGEDREWGMFVLEALLHQRMPKKFPLKDVWKDLLPNQVFVSDWDRWNSRSQ